MKKLFKIQNEKQRPVRPSAGRKQAGMTYVELIVVLGIFAVMSTIVVFNYGEFQAKVDVKNLASDIALKVVEAQKSSLSGKLPFPTPQSTWKPAYGVYFNSSSMPLDTDGIAFNKKFIYFADIDNEKDYDGETSSCTGECLDRIIITKNNYISNVDMCTTDPCVSGSSPINPLSITFTRPNSGASFYTNTEITGPDYFQITIKSPKTATATIKIYPSGRIQVN